MADRLARLQTIAATKEAALAKRSMSYLSKVIAPTETGFLAAVAAAQTAAPPLGRSFVVGTISDDVAAAVEQQLGKTLASRDITITDEQIAYILRDSKVDRMANLPAQLLSALPAFLQIANAWIDPVNQNLIYTVSLGPGLSKIAVHINYRVGKQGAKVVTNKVATGCVVKAIDTGTWVRIK